VIINPVPTIATEAGGKKIMDFYEALKVASEGAMIHSLAWDDMRNYAMFVGGVLKLHKPDGKFYDWIISESDLMEEDYITL